MTASVDEQVRLLHMLGFLYGQHGQGRRGLVLLLLAARLAPENPDILRTLTHILLVNDSPDRALAVIDRLEGLGEDTPALTLLKARALWGVGREMDARQTFREFLTQRPR